MSNAFLANWYFHVPNFVLAAVMYTLMGRIALGLFVPADWDNYIFRAFVRITDPAVAIVRLVTPQILPLQIVMLFGVLWLLVVRILFFIIMNNAGLAPVTNAVG
jgi:uncharacterized protein YggT (Ycf19 family)